MGSTRLLLEGSSATFCRIRIELGSNGYTLKRKPLLFVPSVSVLTINYWRWHQGVLIGALSIALALTFNSTLEAQTTFTTFNVVDVPGASSTTINSINDSGDVAGSFGDLANTLHAFVRISGVYQTIDEPNYLGLACQGSGDEAATGINNNSQVVGVYDRANFPVSGGCQTGSFKPVGFLFVNNTSQDIDNASYSSVSPNSFNDAGNIVGNYKIPSGRFQTTHAFLLKSDEFTNIDPPGATAAWATGINNSGQIVGYYSDSSFNTHGFLLSGGAYTTIDFPGATGTLLVGINNAGMAVGNYSIANQSNPIFVFDSRTPQGPNAFQSFTPPVGSVLTPSAINDADQIVGYDFDQDGSHGFIATVHITSTLSIETMSLPSIGAGLAYNASLAATGGTGTGYTWCVLDGSNCDPNPALPASLPAGFTLDSSGLISAMDGNAAMPGDYSFTAQVTDSRGDTATQTLSLKILGCVNPKDMTIKLGGIPSLDGGLPEIRASFVPGASTGHLSGLITQAGSCGFAKFDWQQVNDVHLTPNLLKPENLSAAISVGSLSAANIVSAPGNPYSDGTLQAGPPSQAQAFFDPPYGGYTYQSPPAPGAALWSRWQPNTFTAWPFYYSPLDLSSGCAIFDDNGCLLPLSDTYTLNFFDSPKSACNFGGMYAFTVYCDYETPLNPAFNRFTTRLVGVCGSSPVLGCTTPGQPSASLYQWTWITNFNGIPNGGLGGIACEPPLTMYCDETSSGTPAIPSSGTGGVTVVSIDGVPSPQVTVNPSVSTFDSLAPLSVSIAIGQFQGRPVPMGTVTLTSGTYTSAATSLDGNGTANVTIPAGALPVGPDVLTAAYAPSAPVSASYSQAWGTAVVTVNAITPHITFTPNPTTQTYGTPITASTLDATAQYNGSAVSGTFTYTAGNCSGAGQVLTAGATVLDAGSYSITACFTPLQTGFTATSETVMYTVIPANQSISFGAIATQLVGATIPLIATVTSGIAASFQTMTPEVCSVSGNTATLLTPGTCTIVATQGGGLDYYPATPVTVSFPVTGLMGFRLKAEPAVETVRRGVPGEFLVKVESMNGFAGDVNVRCAGGPVKSVCRDFPKQVHVRANRTAWVLAAILFRREDEKGTYTITFTGVSGTNMSATKAEFIVR